MQIHRMFFLVVITCIGMLLTPEEQQRKATPTPTPQNNTGVVNQAQPNPNVIFTPQAQKKPTPATQRNTGAANQAQPYSIEQTKPVAPAQTRPGLPGQVQIAPAEQNKAVVRRVFDDLFSRGRYEFIDQIYAKDCPVHSGNRHTRLEQAVAEGKGWRSASPDLLMTVNRIEVERDLVIVDWTAKGTNTGKGNGVPATGKRILIRGNSRFRVANGKIVEVWNNFDRDEIFRQVGVPPKIGHLYDGTQDFLFALNQVFSSKDQSF